MLGWLALAAGVVLLLVMLGAIGVVLVSLFQWAERMHPARGLSPAERRAMGRRYGLRVIVSGLVLAVAQLLLGTLAPWLPAA